MGKPQIKFAHDFQEPSDLTGEEEIQRTILHIMSTIYVNVNYKFLNDN